MAEESSTQPRPFWSGVIAFGLVSLPVSLFSANRGKKVALKMVDGDGAPLKRYYYCEEEGRVLEREEIIRGYPTGEGRFVIVEDDELEALAPEKSREIDLRRFVPLRDINPIYFDRGYFLVPDSDTTKAYRLLARCMEAEERAGIATFVMRDREYLVAIMSEGGILRAETLRFKDDLRDGADIGIKVDNNPDDKQLKAARKALKALSREKLNPSLLQDREAKRILECVDEKREKHQDLVQMETDEEDDGNVIDIMDVLKTRLAGQSKQNDHERMDRPARKKTARKNTSKLESLNREALYEQAQNRQIKGRSKMTKQELVQALDQASR